MVGFVMKRHWKRILAIVLVLMLTSGVIYPVAAAQTHGFFSGGYGTEDSPFLISNAVDFDHIDDFYAAYGDNLPCDPVYFTQTSDIRFYYNSETDNDGSQGYYMYNDYPARPTPVTQMHNAVYDGGGHRISMEDTGITY